MRNEFAAELHKQMAKNKDIWLVTADLGFGLWDKIRTDYPDRFINVGAAEQAGADICVGLSLSGKIPFFYSITTFLLYRPFETLRTYINRENLPVKLVGSGRDKDYHIDGISHDASDAKQIFGHASILSNIKDFWPQTDKEAIENLERMLNFFFIKKPCFISLRR